MEQVETRDSLSGFSCLPVRRPSVTPSILQFHNGQQWDYVFDVDVADGSPPLKMALNAGENPYEASPKIRVGRPVLRARKTIPHPPSPMLSPIPWPDPHCGMHIQVADRFLLQHDLPISYKDQVRAQALNPKPSMPDSWDNPPHPQTCQAPHAPRDMPADRPVHPPEHRV